MRRKYVNGAYRCLLDAQAALDTAINLISDAEDELRNYEDTEEIEEFWDYIDAIGDLRYDVEHAEAQVADFASDLDKNA